jgi:hypothetical protein
MVTNKLLNPIFTHIKTYKYLNQNKIYYEYFGII